MAEVVIEEVVHGQWMEHVVEQGIRFGTERLTPPRPPRPPPRLSVRILALVGSVVVRVNRRRLRRILRPFLLGW